MFTKVEGLGDATKGISDIYKEFHELERDSNEVFKFGDNHVRIEENEKSEISFEHIKKVGEMIGVSWRNIENGRIQNGTREVMEGEFGSIISLTIRRIGDSGKKGWIKSINRAEKPDVIGLQETKCNIVDDVWIEDLWGGNGYGYTQLPSNGNSGGILLIWDKRILTCKEAIGDERFIAVRGSWKGKEEDVFNVCINGPHVTRQKASLWDRLSGLMNRWQGAWCFFGDLNVVRCGDDRLNSQVNLKEANEFNDFINNTRLIKILMGGRKFTRISDDKLEFSKLDRFVLNDMELDFGPKPFRVFNVWMDEADFNHIIEEAWKIEVWGHLKKIDDLKNKAMRWELEAERRLLNDNERGAWLEARKQWRLKIMNTLDQKISMEDVRSLEREIDEKEIWEAIRGCGGNKAPEGLKAIMSEAVEKGIFRGVKIGSDHVMVSHLQYADGTIFWGSGTKRMLDVTPPKYQSIMATEGV
ncbi:RNA-directed DNA polymerase, eukaryota [Tanacetum coccineum]